MESKHAARARPSPPVFAGTMKWVTSAEWSALSIVSSPTSNGAMQREPHLVERSNVHRLQHSPAAQRSRRDQKSRNREENLHSPLPIPYERGNNLLRNPVRLQHICRNKPQVDVVHQHEKDGQPAQQIHPSRRSQLRPDSTDLPEFMRSSHDSDPESRTPNFVFVDRKFRADQ